jgi:hypothetical protein
MNKLFAAAAFTLPLVTVGYAAAGEPMRLTEGQMDGISAGASALAEAAGAGVGDVVLVELGTLADVQVIDTAEFEETTINLHQSTAAAAAAVAAD